MLLVPLRTHPVEFLVFRVLLLAEVRLQGVVSLLDFVHVLVCRFLLELLELLIERSDLFFKALDLSLLELELTECPLTRCLRVVHQTVDVLYDLVILALRRDEGSLIVVEVHLQPVLL